MNTAFKFFDEDGDPVEMKGSEVLNTVTQLQYRYDDEPVVLAPLAVAATAAPAAKEKPVQTVATAEKTGVTLGDRPVHIPVALKAPAKAAVKRLTAAAPALSPDHALVLRLEDVTFDKQPGIYYEVYLNLPDDGEDPEFHNGHYVGNLGFFGKVPRDDKDEHGAAKATHEFDISGVVRNLTGAKKWDPDRLTVTLVPRGLEDATGHPREVKTDAKIRVGKVTLNSPKD
jgi:Protein of unknown function (DUF_B2219)/Polyphenol oxidase middle domain